MVWLVGPAPPRASPARIAALARAPLTLREGGDCSLVVWFVLVVWLVGQV